MDPLEEIAGYYREVDRCSPIEVEMTDSLRCAIWAPSRIRTLARRLDEAIGAGIFSRGMRWCDAGSGDGRVMALFAGVYGSSTLGVEIGAALVQDAREHLDRLAHVVPAPRVQVVQGDFGLPGTYEAAGIPVERIDAFFNYRNNDDAVASLIARHARRGTKLLLSTWEQGPCAYEGLRHLVTMGSAGAYFAWFEKP